MHVGQEAPNNMNGERNNYWLNGGVALALGLIMSSIVLGWCYTHAKKGDEAITVTGSAKKRIKSDLVVWNAGVSVQSAQLSAAYTQISGEIPKIKQYLISKGISAGSNDCLVDHYDNLARQGQ